MATIDTDSEYAIFAPGPSTKNKLRTEIVRKKCVSTYSRLKKAPKSSAERGQKFRARKALLKQQQKPDAKVEIAREDIQSAERKLMEKRARSAEATRRWRAKKKALMGQQKKQVKTAAQRMKEYREREKLAKKILLIQQSDQDLDAIVSPSSSQVNRRVGPSTINSISAELTSFRSFLNNLLQTVHEYTGRLENKNGNASPSDNSKQGKTDNTSRIHMPLNSNLEHAHTFVENSIPNTETTVKEEFIDLDEEELQQEYITASMTVTEACEPSIKNLRTESKNDYNSERNMEENENLIKPVETTTAHNYSDALRILKPLEEFALLKEDYRAIGLISQLEKIFKNPPKK